MTQKASWSSPDEPGASTTSQGLVSLRTEDYEALQSALAQAERKIEELVAQNKRLQVDNFTLRSRLLIEQERWSQELSAREAKERAQEVEGERRVNIRSRSNSRVLEKNRQKALEGGNTSSANRLRSISTPESFKVDVDSGIAQAPQSMEGSLSLAFRNTQPLPSTDATMEPQMQASVQHPPPPAGVNASRTGSYSNTLQTGSYPIPLKHSDSFSSYYGSFSNSILGSMSLDSTLGGFFSSGARPPSPSPEDCVDVRGQKWYTKRSATRRRGESPSRQSGTPPAY